MTENKSNASMISFSKGFDPQETLVLKSSRRGMVWKSKKTSNDIVVRSPLLEVMYPPTPAPGRNLEYSMALRVHVGENSSDALKHQEMFKQLSEAAHQSAIDFMMVEKNGKQYAKKTFESPDEFKVTRFWYDDGKFYMRFRTSVSAHLFDAEGTKKEKEKGTNKKVYHPVRDDVRRYLGAKSLISVDFRPTAFFYQKKETLYPFSLNIEKIVIWAYNENANPDSTSQRSTKKHGFLKGFALDIPLGYKLPEEIEQQTDVPVTHVNTFNEANYSLSRVIDGAKGPVIYARDGDSFGPTYYKATNVVVKWDITADPTYDTRSIVLADCKENAAVIKMVREQFSKLVDTVMEYSEKILGSKCDRETVEESISNPLYSQKDAGRENPRISMKLPREEKSDKPLFELFVLPEDIDSDEDLKTIEPIDMGETCDMAENYIGAGTVCRSLVFMTRPVIVNSQVYLSSRVEQILVDPNQDRVFVPPLNGFAYPGYENVTVETRSSKFVVPFTGKNFNFTNYDDKKKAFSVLFEGEDGKTSEYGVLPFPVTVAFDIGLVNDPDNNQFAYRIRYNHTNDQLLSFIRNIDEKATDHCVENSKDIFGAKKSKKVVEVALGKGKLEKYSKKDTDKKEPYSTMKAPVYEKNDGYNIAFEAYRLNNPVEQDGVPDVQKIPLTQPEDLMEIFHADATVLPVIRIRGTFVDKRIILSTTVAQVLLVPSSVDRDIPFADTVGDDMVSFSVAAQEELNKISNEAVENDNKEEEKEEKEEVTKEVSEVSSKVSETPETNQETVDDAPEDPDDDNASDNEESEDESEEEESDED
jgi:hypothetical protein